MLANVLPVVAVAWIGAAGPCVGMPAAPDAADVPAAAQHDEAHVAHGASAPAHTESITPAAAGAGHSHGACPHCPGAAGAASESHAQCAALDDVAGAKRDPQFAKVDLKLATAPGDTVRVVVLERGLAAARRPDLYHRVFPPSVPLNLRHCILIV